MGCRVTGSTHPPQTVDSTYETPRGSWPDQMVPEPSILSLLRCRLVAMTVSVTNLADQPLVYLAAPGAVEAFAGEPMRYPDVVVAFGAQLPYALDQMVVPFRSEVLRIEGRTDSSENARSPIRSRFHLVRHRWSPG